MLYLGTKRVSYFLNISFLDSDYSLYIHKSQQFLELHTIPQRGLMLKVGQIHQAAESVTGAHGKFRTCQDPYPQQSSSPFDGVERTVRIRVTSSGHTRDPFSNFELYSKDCRSYAGF